MKKIYSLIVIFSILVSFSFAQAPIGRHLWQDVKSDVARFGTPDYTLSHFRFMQLDLQNLKIALTAVPHEKNVTARTSTAVLELPMPDGSYGRFRVVESPVMADELAARYPGIKTYAAQGIDDPTANARLDITEWGFHAQIRSVNGTVLIDPYNQKTKEHYVVFNKKDAARAYEFVCEVDENNEVFEIDESNLKVTGPGIGSELRTYRLALACTGEYAQFHGGTKPSVLSAMVTAMNRVNGIYEVEAGIRMILIPNNDTIIFLNGATDPYTNNSGGTMLGQNQTTLTNYIGSANYDIGHVFSTGGGGIASLNSPCSPTNKARGVTGLPSPIGDPFYVDYVAHEMGHQWGGNHTFNGNSGSCSGSTRVASAAYEPGSATTIMGYAGICSSQNTQSYSDPYFHIKSFQEIIAFSQFGNGNGCAVITQTGNTEPVVNTIPDYTIPYLTPFILTGDAFDPDGDTLTYCWEQYDLGPAGHPNSPSGNAPIFRSFNPTLNNYRYFPRIQNIVSGLPTLGEILPSYARTLNFRLTVRDNRIGGGGVSYNTTTFKAIVIDTGTPFKVTYPDTILTWYANTFETVTWDVSNTDIAPINTPNVDIYLSHDGGFTYPETLAVGVPNIGIATITVPAILTNQARIMVKGSGNIFFDISNKNFEIVLGSSVSEVASNDFNIYPNPVKDKLVVNLTNISSAIKDLTVTDLTGRIIYKKELSAIDKNNYQEIDVASFSQGLYFLKVKTTDGESVKRFIKN